MSKKPNLFKTYFPAIFLALLVAIIALLNFKFGTWLSGWDNLHPEFDLGLNFKRSIFAVWQEYQGLGLLGGMGHASDLPRQIFLWLANLLLPFHFLRYFFHFLMLAIGPLGVYFLLNEIILKQFKVNERRPASLIGAVFYLFNLATLQMFYVPFEPYSVHFAFLPWLFWANLKFVETSSKRNFLVLLFINILAIPQGYVATFFLVYFMALFWVLFASSIKNGQKFKRMLVVFLILLCVNAFWLFPNIYFALTSSDINIDAKINQMATEKNILQNKKYGDLANTTILKGFWFDNNELDRNGEMVSQMGEWATHLENPWVLTIGYSLFCLNLLGFGYALKRRIKVAIVFGAVFVFSFIVLSNDTSFFSLINEWLYKIPLFSQVFRFPFTKFSLLITLCLAIFYALGFLWLWSMIKKPSIRNALTILFCFLPIIFLFPLFSGGLFYDKEKVKIPNDYFQIIDFFQYQFKNTRIANFPQNSFWGWSLYRWLDLNGQGESENYSGSGFLWYGIEQPILDRAFDVWSDKNENYYWEISYALYSQNQALFEKILEKYQINWLLLDGNVIYPSSPKALFEDELEEMIKASKKIFLKKQFGKIKIYQVQLETPVENYVFLAQNLPQIEPVYNWNNYDRAYLEYGHYSTTNNQQLITNNKIYFPFRSLFTGRSQEDLEFSVEDTRLRRAAGIAFGDTRQAFDGQGEDYFIFSQKIPEQFKNYQLVIPEGENKELVWVNPQDLSEIKYLQPEVNFDGQKIELKFPKVGGLYGAEIEPAEVLANQVSVNCNQLSQGEVKNEIVENNLLRLSSLDANNCSPVFWLEHLTHQLSYLITVESRNLEGKSLLFWLENITNRKADIETYLPKNQSLNTSFFIQPPMKSDGLEYSLHFDNISIGRVESVNDLGEITVNPIPFKFLTELKLVSKPEVLSETILVSPLEVSRPNPSYYEVAINNLTIGQSSNQTLILSQAFHDGWIAWEGKPFIGKKLEHILVNNWQNGWVIPGNLAIQQSSKVTIYLFFWPQLLEYFGFILLFGLLGFSVFLVIKRKKSISQNPKHPHLEVLYSS